MELSKIIDLIEEKCLNCHQCISVCPSKNANDGSGNTVKINNHLCIGCGECIKACTHNARIIVDDIDEAFNAIKKKDKIIAFVAPAIAASFPNSFLKFNGWLKSLEIDAIFDVSFGAELTIKSYLEHVKNNKPNTVIAQPCPAIVTYIQIYKPNLLKYLAPAHSPMLHAVKMVKEFYPKYKNHKILMISPCIAKRREFDETGLVDFNVTIATLKKYLSENNIDLNNYKEVEFDNDPAERATLFSTPGGLMETAEREFPSIRMKTRKIEGPNVVYNYINHLEEAINKGVSPLIVDCLNCAAGCNGGTGTELMEASHDELDFYINERAQNHILKYKNKRKSKNETLSELIDKYWKPGIYNREYLNLQENYSNLIKEPTEIENKQILQELHKFNEDDMYNCASCGYNSCNEMAKAIKNNLNKKENCFYYNQKEVEKENILLDQKVIVSNKEIQDSKNDLISQSEEVLSFLENIKNLIN